MKNLMAVLLLLGSINVQAKGSGTNCSWISALGPSRYYYSESKMCVFNFCVGQVHCETQMASFADGDEKSNDKKFEATAICPTDKCGDATTCFNDLSIKNISELGGSNSNGAAR